MSFRAVSMRIAAMFQKKRLEQDLDQDIQEHLQMATEENIRRGMNPREAAEAARRSFGGAEQMKEEFRDQRGIPPLETFLRETRIAFRSLRRAPAFTILAVLTLALGIGANAAIFSAVNALLFNPAGISEPGRIVVVRSKYDKLNLKNLVISFNEFKELSDHPDIFSTVAIAKTGDVTYTGGAYPERLTALRVSGRWFEVFGARPAQGRLFTAEEDQPGSNQVALLSDSGWRRLFGSDPSVVGKTIRLSQQPYKIVGIMRPGFAGIDEFGARIGHDLFIPLAAQDGGPQVRFNETYLAAARLQSGITFEKAQAFLRLLTDRVFEVRGRGRILKENGWGLFAVPYNDFVSGDMKTPMLVLWGAVGVVLLIACSNIAGLMLARTAARSREFAVRTALGGSRWHLLRQMFAENAILTLAGLTVGLGVAYGFIRGVEVWGPENVVGSLSIPFDLRMLVFTAGAAIVSGALFGSPLAGQLRRANASEALKDGGRSGTAGRDRIRFRSMLVIAEVALALVLSIGAGLFLRSLSRLKQVDVGFRPDGVMTAVVTLPEQRYKEPETQLAFYRAVIERLTGLPGVKSAAISYPLPFGTGFEGRAFQIAGRPSRQNEPAFQGQLRLVTPGFFSTLRIPVKRGRVFTEQDDKNSERVTIIDEALAQQYWPNEDPLGQRILQSGLQSRIVGVVGHTKQSDLASDSEKGVFYYPFAQDPVPFATLIVLQTAGNPAGAIQESVQSVDPSQPIHEVKTMEERVSATLAGRRFTVALLALFAAMAVFLAALGLYGVINYNVTQRTQEIGIRMALGARRTQVLGLIIGKGMRTTLIGLALGWFAAFQIAGMLPNQLFGVNAFDPLTFTAMAALLAAVTLFASYIPARRAMKLDPLEACRYE